MAHFFLAMQYEHYENP